MINNNYLIKSAHIREYIVVRGNRRGRRLRSRWYDECERTARPFVLIEPRRTHASVELDLDPAGAALDDVSMARLRALLRSYHVYDHAVGMGPRHIGCAKVPLTKARGLVAAMLDVVYSESAR